MVFRLVHADGRPLGAMKVLNSHPYFDFATQDEAQATLDQWRAERAAMTKQYKKAHWIPEHDDYGIAEVNDG